MSLKLFHVVFITLSTLLCLFMVIWGTGSYRSSHEAFSIALAVMGVLGILLLVPYGRWFWRKMKHLPLACLVCYGDPASPMTHGLVIGVLFLVGVVGFVLATILIVALRWRRGAH